MAISILYPRVRFGQGGDRGTFSVINDILRLIDGLVHRLIRLNTGKIIK